METNKQNIVVIGTSAGGMNALLQLFIQLPGDFPAPILVVQHVSPDAAGDRLLETLNRASKLDCRHALHGEPASPGTVYFAPPDHHLMVGPDYKVLVTKGAHENRSRPAIDPLFRSAAVAYGTGVVGILLTGYLDDGTAGMKVIKQCGGSCIAQDPSEAQYPDMPQHAIDQGDVDHVAPLAEMGALLYRLLSEPSKKMKPVPKSVAIEAAIAQRILSDIPAVEALGSQVPFNCPGCGGVLWKIGGEGTLRFRCHVGHAYTAAALLAEQTSKIDETMWTALRMFEERKNLLTTMSKSTGPANAKAFLERAALSQVHIDRIRAVLHGGNKPGDADAPV